jgi:hypothetical protein
VDAPFIRTYCLARFAQILGTLEPDASLALYGAGTHSAYLDRLLPDAVRARIAFYVDRDASKTTWCGRPVHHPDEAPWSKVGALVISSDRRQEEMFADASSCFAGRVERIYLGLPLDALERARNAPAPPAAASQDALSRFLFSSMPKHEIRWQQPFDIMRVGQLAAAFEAAQYVAERMPDFHYSVTKEDVIRHAVGLAPTDGLVMEFGVMKGLTLNLIASLTPRTVYGFDSFEGLPEAWGFIMGKGTLSTGGQLPPGLAPNAAIVKGWFDETLPAFLAGHDGPLAFAHVDCDVYGSAKFVLDQLAPRLVPGSILVFDDYFNYIGWRNHIHRAFREFVEALGIRYRYLTFASSHCSVAVTILP